MPVIRKASRAVCITAAILAAGCMGWSNSYGRRESKIAAQASSLDPCLASLENRLGWNMDYPVWFADKPQTENELWPTWVKNVPWPSALSEILCTHLDTKPVTSILLIEGMALHAGEYAGMLYIESDGGVLLWEGGEQGDYPLESPDEVPEEMRKEYSKYVESIADHPGGFYRTFVSNGPIEIGEIGSAIEKIRRSRTGRGKGFGAAKMGIISTYDSNGPSQHVVTFVDIGGEGAEGGEGEYVGQALERLWGGVDTENE